MNKEWRPEKSCVGGMEYIYEYREQVLNDSNEGLYGQCNHMEQKIHISTKYSGLQIRASVVHENLHFISNQYYSEEINESFIKQIGNGLFDWMIHNKDTVRWIIGDKN